MWILLKQETVSGSGISWAICKSASRSRQITTPAPHHSVFTGRMPFLLPNQQRQSTEWNGNKMFNNHILTRTMRAVVTGWELFIIDRSGWCHLCTELMRVGAVAETEVVTFVSFTARHQQPMSRLQRTRACRHFVHLAARPRLSTFYRMHSKRGGRKTTPQTRGNNFVKSYSMFNFVSLKDSLVNMK